MPDQENGRSGLDELDSAIVRALQFDGRRAFSSIAADLGVSEGAVRYRVNRLEETGVLQIVGIADPLRIGFDFMALVGLRIRPGAVEAVCRDVATLPETSYVAATTGSYDAFAEVICRDSAHFGEFLTEGLHHVEGLVAADSFLVLDIHKLAYGWGVGRVAEMPAAEPDGGTARKRKARAKP